MKTRKMFQKWILALILIISIVPSVTVAGESDPRDAIPLPGGTNAVLFYYRNISGNQYNVNGNTAFKDAELTANLGIGRYVHYWAIDKWTIAVNLIQPFGNLHTELAASGIDQMSSGLGDTTGNVTAWYPLILEKDNMFWMGAAFYLTAPTGQYDQDKIINLGANRWNYRFEVAPVIWLKGPFTLEVLGNVDIYTDNDKFTANSLTLAQDPVWSALTHVTYNITKDFWIGGSYFYHTGGETSINGVKQNDKITEQKLMFTTGFMITPQTQLLLQYAQDVVMDNGFKTSAIQTRFAYLW